MGEAGAVSWYDSFWFAYISTTTIGFGDIVLSPDVFLTEDIFVWPLTFLGGFVLFAAFIGKLGETIARPLLRTGMALAERLKVEHPIDSMEGEPSGEEQNIMGESGNDDTHPDNMREISSEQCKGEPDKLLEDEIVPSSATEQNPEGRDENVSSLIDAGPGSYATTITTP